VGGYVACVDEDVAIGDFAWVETVEIGDTDDADRMLVASRLRAEESEEVVG
jgi:hypothetical protein